MPDNNIESYGDDSKNYEQPTTSSNSNPTPIQTVVSTNSSNNTVTYVGTDGKTYTVDASTLEQ